MNNLKELKSTLYDIIHNTDSRWGKIFDVTLVIFIILSVIYVCLESVDSIDKKYHHLMVFAEWLITIVFTLEYLLRIYTLKKPQKYIFSFYGIIDLLSTLPLYLSFFITGTGSLVALRSLRLLRIFRILKLVRFMGEASQLSSAIKASKTKILVFIYFVLILSVIFGTIMYLVEAQANSGFSNIPHSIYWTIVTMTTVGYGDIVPQTDLGRTIASVIMILGYGIIAVPTGIVTSEMTKIKHKKSKIKCKKCGQKKIPKKATFCFNCGEKLPTI